jgi:uncharacterized protein (UPF0303 family)
MPGSSAANDSWIERKAHIVECYSTASFLVGRRMEADGERVEDSIGLSPLDFAAAGGSFPIRILDVGVIGTVTQFRVDPKTVTRCD